MAKSSRTRALEALEDALDSEFLLAIAEPVRVKILRILIADGPSDVGSVAEQLPQERSVISRHLRLLSNAGLLRVERDGRHRIYALIPSAFVRRLEDILDTTRQCIMLCCPGELDPVKAS